MGYPPRPPHSQHCPTPIFLSASTISNKKSPVLRLSFSAVRTRFELALKREFFAYTLPPGTSCHPLGGQRSRVRIFCFPQALTTKKAQSCDWASLRCGRDSNSRPPAWQAGILTNWTTAPFGFGIANVRAFCENSKFFCIIFTHFSNKCQCVPQTNLTD